MPRIAWVVELRSALLANEVAALRRRLSEAGLADIGSPPSVTTMQAADAVVVWADQPLAPELAAMLAQPSVIAVLAGPTLTDADPWQILSDAAGLLVRGSTPPHDVRLRAGPDAGDGVGPGAHGHGDSSHRDEHEHLFERVALIDKATDDVQVLRTARIGLVDHPVMTWRPVTATAAWSMGTTPEAVSDRSATRALAQLLRRVCDVPGPQPIRVGLLGYGAIGHEHSRAARAVPGLALSAVCDTSEDRRAAAAAAADGVAVLAAPEDLLARDDVDLIVVSTPPNTHARWALRAIESGKHVVVEKPFALHTADADAVLAAAKATGRLAVVYQNRRYDPDYLALRQLVRAHALGEVFHIETFVGGYGHPCNLWHSDEDVSGGAFYDWGSHVLDQVLDLVPSDVVHVTATNHKLRWFDVTNADHSRVSVRFDNGVEAEFMHSDLAAALKPRWYVLGSQGAVVGQWRTERVLSRSDIGTLVEDVLAPADSVPVMELHAADGSVTRIATPDPQSYGFHRELVDRLQLGLPMTVTGEQSRRVLAVMEAARASAADSGTPKVPR